MPEFNELSDFPGPLVAGRTHKGEVIQFCQNKIQDAKRKQGTKDDIGKNVSHKSFGQIKRKVLQILFYTLLSYYTPDIRCHCLLYLF